MDVDRWRELPAGTDVSATTLDVAGWLRRTDTSGRKRTSDELTVDLPSVWADVGERALGSHSLVSRWVTPSTLIACAPGDVSDRSFIAEATRRANERGARYPAAIYPANDPRGARWTAYRDWFAHATALDAGGLRATAVCDPERALDAAATVSPPGVTTERSDAAVAMSVGSFTTTIDAVADAFVGIMRGFAPEQTLAAAIAGAGERLRRSDALLERLRDAIGVDAMRFVDGVPAYLVDDVVVVDPVATRFLDGGDLPAEWPDRLAAALRPGAAPRCTCGEIRVVRADLAELADDDALSIDVDRTVELRFGMACSHDARTPSAAEWIEAGVDAREAVRRWRDAAVATEWQVADTDDRTAVLCYGPGAAALTADDVLAPALVAACGHVAGEEAAAVALAANVVLVTQMDEAVPEVDLRSLDDAGFSPGPSIRFVKRVRSAGIAEPRLRTAPLALRP